jgi:hypothetical protein
VKKTNGYNLPLSTIGEVCDKSKLTMRVSILLLITPARHAGVWSIEPNIVFDGWSLVNG